MKNTSLRALLARLNATGIIKKRRPAKRNEIDATSRMLAVEFPRTYVEFLETCGMLEVYERSVFGLGPDTWKQDWNSAFFHTLEARKSPVTRLPPHLVVLWHDSHMDYQCLDTGRVRGGDCPVVCFDSDIARSRARRPKPVADGFHAWLELIVAKELKNKAAWDAHVASKNQGRARKRSTKK